MKGIHCGLLGMCVYLVCVWGITWIYRKTFMHVPSHAEFKGQHLVSFSITLFFEARALAEPGIH